MTVKNEGMEERIKRRKRERVGAAQLRAWSHPIPRGPEFESNRQQTFIEHIYSFRDKEKKTENGPF